MKGYRFYEELDYKNRKAERSQGTVVARCVDIPMWVNGADDVVCEAVVGVFNEPNSPVCYSQVTLGYLDRCCRRVSEKVAREIHPSLFEYLGG